ALVEDDVRRLLAETPFAGAPIVRVAPGDEMALTAVRQALATALRLSIGRDPEEPFRLPVDRVFSVRGTGTVVTGTTWSGSLSRDAEVRILPSGRSARVRGVQMHGAPAERALPGHHTAIALGGVDLSEVHRGDVIVQHAAWEPSLAVRADVTLLADAPIPLGPRTAVRFHLGTADVGARLVARGGACTPGESRPVRIVLDAPVVARAGDRFVLRLPSPMATIGGGTVTDPHATRRSRPFPALGMDPVARLAVLLAEADGRGLSRESLLVRLAPSAGEVADAVVGADAVGAPGSDHLLSRTAWDEGWDRMVAFLDGFHADQPLASGASRQELRVKLRLPPAFAEALVARGIEAGVIETEGAEVRRSGWTPSLTPAQGTTLAQILQRLSSAGREPPGVGELVDEFGAQTADLLRLAAARGEIVQVDADRYYTAASLAEIIGRLTAHFQAERAVAPAEVRELLGLSRKYVIPLLEYCDRAELTRRHGDGRVWVGTGGRAG
ncbi:MAG: SelB C-terminal domain-containing protein, partial [Gemmatimonadaceae bacterium]